MARILIVDDERDYREQLQDVLTWDGHDARIAGTARHAIDVAARFHPELIVADWMLRNHVHGLHVVEALQVICPAMRAVLITGFCSGDVRADAARTGVCRLLEKPFDLERFRAAVAEALSAEPPRRVPLRLGVIELTSTERLVFANPRARTLMSATPAGADQGAAWCDCFTPAEPPDLSAAEKRWICAAPGGAPATTWHLRAQPPQEDGSRLVVILEPEDPHHLHRRLIETLLGVEEPRAPRWPFDGQVLVLDGDELTRHLAVALLESAGATCYAVETPDAAARLLAANDRIQAVVADCDSCGTDLDAAIRRLAEAAPRCVIVGAGEPGTRARFAAAGVQRLIPRLWRAADLIEVL